MIRTALFVACLLPAVTVTATEMLFSGKATAISDSRVIYEEHHVVEGECSNGVLRPGLQTVNYTRDGGNGFAEKTLSYGESLLRPTVDFRQPDFNEVMEITNRGDNELGIEWQTPEGDTETF